MLKKHQTLYRIHACEHHIYREMLPYSLHEKVILPKFVGVRKYVINSEAI